MRNRVILAFVTGPVFVNTMSCFAANRVVQDS